MKEAVESFREVSTSKEFKERERLWAKARLDEATALHFAEQAGRDKERAKSEKLLAKKDAEFEKQLAKKDTEIEKLLAKKDAELEKLLAEKDAEIARLSQKNND